MAFPASAVDRTRFGSSGPEITIVGLGGEGVLRTWGRGSEAEGVIRQALTEGIGYFDSARVYSGSESYYGSVWTESPEDRGRIFQTSKSASRDRDGALADLHTTLDTLSVSHLDLWQIHDVRTREDLRQIEGGGGALEAFLQAREEGLARHIGVTGHSDPEILARAVSDWPLDSVLLPVNPVESVLGGFLDTVLPLALQRGMAAIGMKILGASHYLSSQAGLDPQTLIRYALSQGITLAIVGCSTPGEVRELAAAGRGFEPMTPEEQERIKDTFSPHVRRLAFYREIF